MLEKDATSDLQIRIAELEAKIIAAHSREHALKSRIDELESQIAPHQPPSPASADARLNALLSICAASLLTHEVEAIVSLVVHESRDLFACSSGILLFLAESDPQRLILRASSNALVPELIIDPGQGIVGRAFLAPRAMLMIGPTLEAAIKELQPAQIQTLQDVLDAWPPSSAIVAPLRVNTQRLGALALYSGNSPQRYHPRDLPFIQALADLTAIAIDEVRQRERAAALQHALAQTRSLHAEAQARLNAAQAQLLQSAKLAAVGELAASVAHEINNPLYAARNSLYLVEQELPPEAPQRTFLSIAQNELGRIARIITRMHDFYRPTRAELEPINMNDLLDETVELVQTHMRHSHVVVDTELTPDLPLLIAHADQLRQVFLNLMLNACDAMPSGGTLYINTTYIPGKNDHPPSIAIRVSDTGVGIADEHQAHLFEPFYTTKPQGTGLGLAISAHIVTQHAGHISVESAVGEGTTFTVTLPVNSDG